MKKILFISIITFFMFYSCAKKEYGKQIEVSHFTDVELIKRNPENFLNTLVKVRGKVVEESPRGLWITLQDKVFIIHINFENQLFSLPSLLSNRVEVIGRFVKNKDGYFIDGKWLKIK